jgi:uncharacterized membrane protein
MKNYRMFLSLMFLLLTINSFGKHDNEGHESFEGAHAFPFSSIAVILLIVAIVIAGILFYKRFSKKAGNKAEELNETAHNVADERHAKGEISKTEYIAINDKLAQLDDEPIEIAKLRLAKGEIDMKEYEEIYNVLVKNQAN